MQCPTCDAPNGHDARFCHACGARLATPLAAQCPTCAAHAAAGAAFCNECGASLKISLAPPTAPAADSPAAPDAVARRRRWRFWPWGRWFAR